MLVNVPRLVTAYSFESIHDCGLRLGCLWPATSVSTGWEVADARARGQPLALGYLAPG
jgi:hypothetical protein